MEKKPLTKSQSLKRIAKLDRIRKALAKYPDKTDEIIEAEMYLNRERSRLTYRVFGKEVTE